MEFLQTVSNSISALLNKYPSIPPLVITGIFIVLTIRGLVWMYKNRPSKNNQPKEKSNVFLVIIYIFVWFFMLVLSGAYLRDSKWQTKDTVKLTGGLNIDVLTDTPF
jgi:hypothetical protein